MKKFTPYLMFISVLAAINLATSVIKFSSNNFLLSIYQIIFIKSACLSIFLTPKYAMKIKNINKKDTPLLLFTIICAIVETYIMHMCTTKLPITNMSLMSFSMPFMIITLGYIFLKEITPLNRIIGMFISIFAVFIVVDLKQIHLSELVWYGIMILNMFVASFSLISMKILSQKYDSSLIVYLRTLGIFATTLITLDKFPSNLTENRAFLILLISGVYIYERIALGKVYQVLDINKIQPMKFLNIIFASIFSYLLLNEPFTTTQLICSGVILLSFYISYGKLPSKMQLSTKKSAIQ